MNELESGVPPLKLCRQISGQLSELLNCPVVCKYDESENLFYAQIFDVVFDRFDEVEAKVSDYSNANYERLGAFCIPVIFTPEQTRDCFPMYAELETERDRLREALKEVLNCEVVTDTGDYSKGGTGFDCNEVKEIIRGALAE